MEDINVWTFIEIVAWSNEPVEEPEEVLATPMGGELDQEAADEEHDIEAEMNAAAAGKLEQEEEQPVAEGEEPAEGEPPVDGEHPVDGEIPVEGE